jgi:hypothetical protein
MSSSITVCARHTRSFTISNFVDVVAAMAAIVDGHGRRHPDGRHAQNRLLILVVLA